MFRVLQDMGVRCRGRGEVETCVGSAMHHRLAVLDYSSTQRRTA